MTQETPREERQQNAADGSLGDTLNALRKKTGYTQAELAEELHITRQAISNWERNINQPDIGTLQRLCALFGIGMEELIMRTMNGKNDSGEISSDRPAPCAEQRRECRFNKYDLAIGLSYAAWFVLGVTVFFTGGLRAMELAAGQEEIIALGWGRNLFAGIGVFLVPGLLVHMVITLLRKA